MTWRECPLGDVITLKRGHDLPKSERGVGSVPVISSSGNTGTHNEAKALPPGVVTGRYGTIGEVFFVEEPYWPLNTALYVIDFKGNDPRFVAYLLRNTLRDYRTEKAAVPGVDRNVLHTLRVRIPCISKQSTIASILSAYDDLIENNRRRIALLEDAARLLYREWFVHFRFPGHEHVKFIDGLPEGWERLPASDAFEINPRTDRTDKGPITYVPMAALSEVGMTIDRTPFQMRRKTTGVRFCNGDTLLARITPSLENGENGLRPISQRQRSSMRVNGIHCIARSPCQQLLRLSNCETVGFSRERRTEHDRFFRAPKGATELLWPLPHCRSLPSSGYSIRPIGS